jgi:hypothetical protein
MVSSWFGDYGSDYRKKTRAEVNPNPSAIARTYFPQDLFKVSSKYAIPESADK